MAVWALFMVILRTVNLEPRSGARFNEWLNHALLVSDPHSKFTCENIWMVHDHKRWIITAVEDQITHEASAEFTFSTIQIRALVFTFRSPSKFLKE